MSRTTYADLGARLTDMIRRKRAIDQSTETGQINYERLHRRIELLRSRMERWRVIPALPARGAQIGAMFGTAVKGAL